LHWPAFTKPATGVSHILKEAAVRSCSLKGNRRRFTLNKQQIAVIISTILLMLGTGFMIIRLTFYDNGEGTGWNDEAILISWVGEIIVAIVLVVYFRSKNRSGEDR